MHAFTLRKLVFLMSFKKRAIVSYLRRNILTSQIFLQHIFYVERLNKLVSKDQTNNNLQDWTRVRRLVLLPCRVNNCLLIRSSLHVPPNDTACNTKWPFVFARLVSIVNR